MRCVILMAIRNAFRVWQRMSKETYSAESRSAVVECAAARSGQCNDKGYGGGSDHLGLCLTLVGGVMRNELVSGVNRKR